MVSYVLFGALAQLGERYTGSVEVSGSIPLCSTNLIAGRTGKSELIVLPYGFVLASHLTSPL